MFDEEKLVKKAKKGDREAQEELYKEYFKPLFYYIRFRSRTSEDAEDIVAESFIKAFKNIEGFDGNSTFKTWLYTIAKNSMLDFYRKKSNSQKKYDLHEYSEFITNKEDSVVDNNENQIEVMKILNKLKENYRQVLELRFLLNCTIKESAEIMETTEGNIKVMQNRALKKARSISK